jgi:hypothetical protein
LSYPPPPQDPQPYEPGSGGPSGAPQYQPGYAQPTYPQQAPPPGYQPAYPPTAPFPAYDQGVPAYQPPSHDPSGYQPGQPAYQPYNPVQPGSPPRPPRKSNAPLVAVIIAVALLLCGGVTVAGVLAFNAGVDKAKKLAEDNLPSLPSPPVIPTALPTSLPTELPQLPGLPTDDTYPKGRAVTVVYEITGDGPATITYTAKLGDPPKRVQNAKLPWRVETSMTVPALVSVIAFRTGTGNGSLKCKAMVDGQSVAEQSRDGAYAVTTCSKLMFQ